MQTEPVRGVGLSVSPVTPPVIVIRRIAGLGKMRDNRNR